MHDRVKFNDKFYTIHNEGFFYEPSETLKQQGIEDRKHIQYPWVIPLYVKSINANFDGVESFDLCPVDVTTLKDRKGGWKWSRDYEYEQIGTEIFYTISEAWEAYNKKYSEEKRKVYEEYRRLRFLQEGKATLI